MVSKVDTVSVSVPAKASHPAVKPMRLPKIRAIVVPRINGTNLYPMTLWGSDWGLPSAVAKTYVYAKFGRIDSDATARMCAERAINEDLLGCVQISQLNLLVSPYMDGQGYMVYTYTGTIELPNGIPGLILAFLSKAKEGRGIRLCGSHEAAIQIGKTNIRPDHMEADRTWQQMQRNALKYVQILERWR